MDSFHAQLAFWSAQDIIISSPLANIMNLSVNVMMTMIQEILEPFRYFLYSIFEKLMKSFGFLWNKWFAL